MKNQMKDAMTRTALFFSDNSTSNSMKAALTENRVGAHAKPAVGDRQVRAMSNEFELDQTSVQDAMIAAMSERRVAFKPKKSRLY